MAELAIVSAGLQLFQGFQGYQQGKAQAKAATQTANYNATVEAQRAATEKSQLAKQQRLMASTSRARAAGSGATLESFSDVEESNKTQSLLDLAMVDYDSRLRQDQIIYGGKTDAANAKSQGTSALISGIAGAGMSGYEYSKQPKTTAINPSYGFGNKITWNSR